MRLTFLGSGEAFFSGHRAHTSVLIEDTNGTLLLECGMTAPLAARKVQPRQPIDTVLVSHLHGDHFGGLPFLLLSWAYEDRRTAPVDIIGPPGLERQVAALLLDLYPDHPTWSFPFAIRYRELRPGDEAVVNGRRVRASAADHMTPAFMALSFRLESEGRHVAYSGDTGPAADLTALCSNADLFICECTLPEGDRSHGHLSATDVAARRSTWSARRVILAHLSAESRATLGPMDGTLIADDGLVVEL